MRDDRYSVLIIGCGNIAGGYDEMQPKDSLPLGHAKAYINHGGFKLTACIEPDATKRIAFQNRWNVPNGFANFQDLKKQEFNFDVISICSPTSSHANDLQQALSLNPKLIFCEKPLTSSLHETKRIVSECSNSNILLAVNYSRRWSPQVKQVKSELESGKWGEIRSISAVYNKGILNNGSHMLDLLSFLFGHLRLTAVGQILDDFSLDDPTVDATLISNQGFPIHLNVAHAKDYALFELQVVTQKGMICMEDGGSRWRFRQARPSDQLHGYHFLTTSEWIEPKGSFALTGAVSNIYKALQNEAPLISTGVNAVEAQSLCEQIKTEATTKAADHQFLKESL
jgi:predicted dehydrogenase